MKKAVSLEKETTFSLDSLGSIYYDNRHYQEALVCYMEAHRMEPDNNDYLKVKQDCQIALGITVQIREIPKE